MKTLGSFVELDILARQRGLPAREERRLAADAIYWGYADATRLSETGTTIHITILRDKGRFVWQQVPKDTKSGLWCLRTHRFTNKRASQIRSVAKIDYRMAARRDQVKNDHRIMRAISQHGASTPYGLQRHCRITNLRSVQASVDRLVACGILDREAGCVGFRLPDWGDLEFLPVFPAARVRRKVMADDEAKQAIITTVGTSRLWPSLRGLRNSLGLSHARLQSLLQELIQDGKISRTSRRPHRYFINSGEHYGITSRS